jgi:hypothetical protein
MAHARTTLGQDPEYDRFLGAAVGEDERGASVTVLSMFSRLGVDPWGEAAGLASMSEGPARQRLEALVARFTDVPSPTPERSETISRLLSFLPKRAGLREISPDGLSRKLALPSLGTQLLWVIGAALVLGYIGSLTQGG